jgi:N-ethylmaleimide reductase
VSSGVPDAIVFGKMFIANPDLVERFKLGEAPLNPLRVETLYGGGAEGHTDYPRLAVPV